MTLAFGRVIYVLQVLTVTSEAALSGSGRIGVRGCHAIESLARSKRKFRSVEHVAALACFLKPGRCFRGPLGLTD